MNGTKAIELHKIFKRHKFTDQETKMIVEAMDKKTDIELVKIDINWIKWIVGIGFSVMVALIIGLWADNKTDVREIRANMEQMKADMRKMQADIKEIKSNYKKLNE